MQRRQESGTISKLTQRAGQSTWHKTISLLYLISLLYILRTLPIELNLPLPEHWCMSTGRCDFMFPLLQVKVAQIVDGRNA
jgi:hypothetical protein